MSGTHSVPPEQAAIFFGKIGLSGDFETITVDPSTVFFVPIVV